MVEKVGVCLKCNKTVYCIDGFLNGVVNDAQVYCFECLEDEDR
ncbi:hypothetical protein JOC75_003579 [Metabacillus crassostreae]|nr:hypothetical protein [Metabacillus crassostreae]MBM7605556.1 hypothetical protein [Metabacillus crassostreae]